MIEPAQTPPQSAFDQVAEEIGKGHYRAGIQARAIAECEGDEAKSKARYISLRAADIWAAQQGPELAKKEKEKKETSRIRLEIFRNLVLVALLFIGFMYVAYAIAVR